MKPDGLIKIDFRLLAVSGEIYSLEEHLVFIERQIKQTQAYEHERITAYFKKENLCPDDSDWHMAIQDYSHRVEFLLPRFSRGAFIIMLYAVYESSITEVARLIQNKNKQEVTINNMKGNFLKRAKRYYDQIIKFDICLESRSWQKIQMLYELRNAFAHANGRLEILNANSRKKIKQWEQQDIGISSYYGYITFDERIVKEIFDTVKLSLEDLVTRYKIWDDRHMHT